MRGPGHRPAHHPVPHHPGVEHDPQQLQHGLVADAFLDRLHQPVFRNRLETIGDVRLDHPHPTPPGLVHEHVQGVVHRAFRAEPETARQHIRLEDRFEHDLQHGLHDPIPHRRDRQRPPLPRPIPFRDQHLASRQRPIPAITQLRFDLGQEPVNTVFLDRIQGELVNARRAIITAHRDPRTPQDVPAQDLVHQRVEPSPGTGLGRPAQRVLQGTHLTPRGTWVPRSAGLAKPALTGHLHNQPHASTK